MIIFDSHCHPQFPQYDADRKEVINKALGEGVYMICVGTDYETSKAAIELAGEYGGIWASVGLHPNDNLDENFEPEKYAELLKKEKVVALGEIGLDYYRTEKPEDQQVQKERFIQQLELAKEFKKPLILHCRDLPRRQAGSEAVNSGRAYKDMIEILSKGYCLDCGVIHSFTGTIEEAREFTDLGLYLGFNGIITFSRQYDEIIREIPLDQILLETDAPYLTPEPYRGKRNEPSYVVEVAKKIAELKNSTYETVINQTTENCKKLFRIADI